MATPRSYRRTVDLVTATAGAKPAVHPRIHSLPPPPLEQHETARLRAAAFQSVRVIPGPIGELIQKELLTWVEFGYRFGGGSLIDRLVREVERLTNQAAQERARAAGA